MTMAAAAAVPLKQVLRGSVVLSLGSKFKSNGYNHFTNLANILKISCLNGSLWHKKGRFFLSNLLFSYTEVYQIVVIETGIFL